MIAMFITGTHRLVDLTEVETPIYREDFWRPRPINFLHGGTLPMGTYRLIASIHPLAMVEGASLNPGDLHQYPIFRSHGSVWDTDTLFRHVSRTSRSTFINKTASTI